MPFAWLFTDMNSYFASVEQSLRPELAGRPIAVVPVEAETTAVIAASHQAKARGVRMGMKIFDARRLCPELLLVKARPREYVRIHEEILRCVDGAAPVCKVYSIDEWSVKLVGEERTAPGARRLALDIKARLRATFGPMLTCSIGIAPSRLLAKIASDLQKPDGLTLLTPADMPAAVAHLRLQDLCGIGPGNARRLEAAGVRDTTALWNLSRREADRIWGSVSGGSWWAGFHGIDEAETPTRKRSIGHSNVLSPELRTSEGARGMMSRLVARLGARMRAEGYFARRLSLSVTHIGGPAFSADCGLPGTQDTPTLLEHARRLWAKRSGNAGTPLKVGVVAGDLIHQSQIESPLFDEARKPLELSRAVDLINRRFGQSSVSFGAAETQRLKMEDKIAFGRIPKLAKRVERVVKPVDAPRTNSRRGVV